MHFSTEFRFKTNSLNRFDSEEWNVKKKTHQNNSNERQQQQGACDHMIIGCSQTVNKWTEIMVLFKSPCNKLYKL